MDRGKPNALIWLMLSASVVQDDGALIARNSQLSSPSQDSGRRIVTLRVMSPCSMVAERSSHG